MAVTVEELVDSALGSEETTSPAARHLAVAVPKKRRAAKEWFRSIPSWDLIEEKLGVRQFIVNALAMSGLLFAAIGDVLVSTILIAISLSMVLIAQRGFLKPIGGRIRPCGNSIVARAAAPIAACFIAKTMWGDVTLLCVAGMIVVVLCMAERPAIKLAVLARPFAANIPSHDLPMSPRLGVHIFFSVNVFNTIVLFATALLGLPAYIPLITAIVGVILCLIACRETWKNMRIRHRLQQRVPKIIARQDPRFMVHWHADKGTGYQLAMWLPYLERLGENFFILVRTVDNLREVAKLTDRPVVLKASMVDVEDLLLPQLKVVFYVNNGVKNSHVLRFPTVKHIQLNHGDSDKAPSFNPVMRAYDRNFVAGQAAIDRFSDHGIEIREKQFEIVGRPQLEDLKVGKRSAFDPARPVVLYAPTWEGFYKSSSDSSLSHGLEIIETLVKKYNAKIIFRSHPYTNRSPELMREKKAIIALLKKENSAHGTGHIFGKKAEDDLSISQCMNRSDMLITDISSVPGDYLYTLKPLIMCSTVKSKARFQNMAPMSKASYVLSLRRDISSELQDIMESILMNDPMTAKRRKLKKYYLGNIPANQYASRFVEVASKYLV